MLQVETDFLIAEFDALRREIELKVKEIAELWRYAIVSSGAIWAWLLSKPVPTGGQRVIYFQVVFFLPFVLTAFLFLGNILLRREINRTASYIQSLEQNVFCKQNGYGWETSLAKDRKGKISKHYQHERWENVLWLFLCAGNLALPIAVIHGK